MRKAASTGRPASGLLALALWCAAGILSPAAAVTEEFPVQGLVSPRESEGAGRGTGGTARGQGSRVPVARHHERLARGPGGSSTRGAVSRDEIAAVIEDTEDPTGRKFRVHTGPPVLSVALLAEETTADGVLGDPASKAPALTNPVEGPTVNRWRGAKNSTSASAPGATGRTATAPDPRPTASMPTPASSGSGAAPATRPTATCFRSSPTVAPTCRPGAWCSRRANAWDLVNYVKTLKAPQ